MVIHAKGVKLVRGDGVQFEADGSTNWGRDYKVADASTPVAPVNKTVSIPAPSAQNINPNATSKTTVGTNPADEMAKINDEINTKQEEEFNTLSQEAEPTVDLSTSGKLAERLTTMLDEKDRPTAPSLVDTFNEQKKALGVGVLEDELASKDLELSKLESDYLSTNEDVEGKQISLGQIGKRQTAVEKQYLRAKRDLTAERNSIASRIDTKMNVVKTMVDLTGKDYDNASQEYDSRFNKTLQVTNLIKGIEGDEQDKEEKKKDEARANVTVMYNLLKEGNLKYDALDPAMKTNITKMEVQAGLPSGFFRYLQTNVKDDIVASTARESDGAKYYDIIIKGKDGALTTKSIYLGKTDTTGGGSSDTKIVENFSKDVADTDARIKAGSNGQFMRSLYAKYPQIDKSDIERKVNETYPEGWDQ